MKKITVKNTSVIYESQTEPLLWGGCQIPFIRYADGALTVKFMGRKDAVESYGKENLDPIYKSTDGGKSWQKSDISAWRRSAPLLPNGDRYDFIQRKNFIGTYNLPGTEKMANSSREVYVHKIDDISHIVKGLEKSFTVSRIPKGEAEAKEEICPVRWKDMPVNCYVNENEIMITQISPAENDVKADSDGVLWLPVYADAAACDAEPLKNRYNSVHLLRSDDMGHSWDYVSSVYYDASYNDQSAYSIEGFNEATLEILENGDFLMIMRSGSLHPLRQNGRPIPKMFSVRSHDKGKTWSKPEVFFDYGIHPHSIKANDGTVVLISGRPGVYLMTCEDPEGKIWSDIFELVHVPDEDVLTKYYEYTCSNSDICITDDGRIFVSYSSFNPKVQPPTKSILVSELALEEI